MTVAWSFYSARRRVSIKQYVKRRNLGSYDDLIADLADRGIAPPGKEQYITEVGKSPVPSKAKPKPESQKTKTRVKPKSKPKSKPTRSLPKKTKVDLPASEADEAWEAVNSEYSDKDKKQ
jgi:hypothetical protein